jgi:hypothetical protein
MEPEMRKDISRDTSCWSPQIRPQAISLNIGSPLPTMVAEYGANDRASSPQYASRRLPGMDAVPVSPQEMEEYTLPVPINMSSLLDEQLAYTTFHPTLPPQGISY